LTIISFGKFYLDAIFATAKKVFAIHIIYSSCSISNFFVNNESKTRRVSGHPNIFQCPKIFELRFNFIFGDIRW